MASVAPRRQQKTTVPLMTGQEALYLRFLSEKQVPVNVKLRDGEVVSGWIEYYDDGMIRLTREGKPNLFIYKQQIRTISELVRKEEGRRRVALRKEAAAEEQALKEHQQSLEPGPIEPGPIEPGPIEPGPIEPGPVEPGPVEPGPDSAAAGNDQAGDPPREGAR